MIRKVLIFIFIFLLTGNVFASSAQDTVKVGSYVISLHDINFHDKEYVIRFWVWMSYKNPDLNFVKRVEVPSAKEMEIQDMMTDTTDGVIWVLMKLKCTMKQNWKVQDFPFDKQRLEVNIENSEFDTRSLVFVADTSGHHFDPEMTVDGWTILNFTTKTKANKYMTDFGDKSIGKPESEYACYSISLDLDRNAWGLFLKMFIGMYIAFLIAFISFYIDFDDVDPRFGLPVGGLFGSIGNKYIIDTMLPESSSFSLVDSLHSLTFISIFVIMAISVYSLRVFESGDKERARRIDKRGRNTVIALFVVINLTLVFLAIWH